MRPVQHTWEKVDGELREGKKCRGCKKWIPLAGFHQHKATHDKLQYDCRACQGEKQRERNLAKPERRRAINEASRKRLKPEYWREHNQKLKRSMVDAYGGKCACCGETELAFLTLDHVGGGGHQERKKVGGGATLLRRLRDAGWPQNGYRILCMNCNMATAHGRTCPHQLKKDQS